MNKVEDVKEIDYLGQDLMPSSERWDSEGFFWTIMLRFDNEDSPAISILSLDLFLTIKHWNTQFLDHSEFAHYVCVYVYTYVIYKWYVYIYVVRESDDRGNACEYITIHWVNVIFWIVV